MRWSLPDVGGAGHEGSSSLPALKTALAPAGHSSAQWLWELQAVPGHLRARRSQHRGSSRCSCRRLRANPGCRIQALRHLGIHFSKGIKCAWSCGHLSGPTLRLAACKRWHYTQDFMKLVEMRAIV